MIPGTIPMPAVAKIKNDFQIFTASGTFNVPAGVTSVFVVLMAAGGTGGASAGYQVFVDGPGDYWAVTATGGDGGQGGVAVGFLSVTPGAAMTVTIGTAGGSSSFSSMSATGGGNGGNGIRQYVVTSSDGSGYYQNISGADGTDGIGSGGSLYNNDMDQEATVDTHITNNILTPWNNPLVSTADISSLVADSGIIRSSAAYSTTWSNTNIYVPGAGGVGSTSGPTQNNLAGMNGLCLIAWGGDL